MDDAKLLLLSFILVSSLFSAPSRAAEIEYIGPDKQRQLEDLFEKSSYSGPQDDSSLKKSKWLCDMYGVRSRMQVQHGLELYSWNPSDKVSSWHNEGAQLVSDYKASPGALVGFHERFEDQVKLTTTGQLISRLSVISPQRVVVAYSVCNSLSSATP